MAGVSITIEVKNLDSVKTLFNQTLPTTITETIEKVLQDTAQEMEDITTRECPVRTGFLRSSIDISAEGFNINAIAAADYASFVDEGTIHMSPRNFFKQPIEEIGNGLGQDIDDALQEEIDRID